MRCPFIISSEPRSNIHRNIVKLHSNFTTFRICATCEPLSQPRADMFHCFTHSSSFSSREVYWSHLWWFSFILVPGHLPQQKYSGVSLYGPQKSIHDEHGISSVVSSTSVAIPQWHLGLIPLYNRTCW